MATARLSLAQAIGRPLTMAGEPPLTGHPHCSPGIVARHNRVREPILPEANRPDFDDLPDYLREGLTVHFVADSRRWPRSPSATPPRREPVGDTHRGRRPAPESGFAPDTGRLTLRRGFSCVNPIDKPKVGGDSLWDQWLPSSFVRFATC
jgi:hypothetical protein